MIAVQQVSAPVLVEEHLHIHYRNQNVPVIPAVNHDRVNCRRQPLAALTDNVVQLVTNLNCRAGLTVTCNALRRKLLLASVGPVYLWRPGTQQDPASRQLGAAAEGRGTLGQSQFITIFWYPLFLNSVGFDETKMNDESVRILRH